MSNVRKAENLEDYRRIQREQYSKYKEQKPVEVNGIKQEEPKSELQFLVQMIELLAQINKNMDRLVQLWEENPKRKIPFFN